ncbi:MAG: cobalamin biosynthesis protein [Thaumarchaeota archaeon]|nr:cobalamin biosynthesis protein [Nitrososphaerota archaeon]
MILVPVISVLVALALDLSFGDPKNKYHPTAWVGALVGRLAPMARSSDPGLERAGGMALVALIALLVGVPMYFAGSTLGNALGWTGGTAGIIAIAASILAMGLLLKTTIAIRGMERHAEKIMGAISRGDLEMARASLSMIVKRSTKDLDRSHVISATLESVSENIVDGITGPMFYFAFFGLSGAFVYRVVNTADSMVGYRTDLFRNLGWFAANCDKVLNYVPSRLTSLVMVLACLAVGSDWKASARIMRRDGPKTESPNAGYPMATMAGALGVRFEKINHYVLGDGGAEFTDAHFRTAISVMKVTALLFAGLFTIPVILLMSYLGWWLLA